jgi:superfamily II DNA or RNA helicase
MYLDGYMMDELFQAALDQEILLEHRDTLYLVTSELFRPRITVRAERDGLTLTLETALILIKGLSHLFILAAGKAHICGKEYTSACSDLLFCLGTTSNIYFNSDDARNFMGIIYKSTQNFIDFNLVGADRFAPPPLKTKIWLDLAANNKITARMEFFYDKKSHKAFATKDNGSLDLEAELRQEELLVSNMHGTANGVCYLDLDDDEAVYLLATEGIPKLLAVAEVFISEALKRHTIVKKPSLTVGVRVEGQLLDLAFDFEGFSPAELSKVLDAYRRRRRYYRLRDGSFLMLDDDKLAPLTAIVDGLDVSEKEISSGHTRLNRFHAPYLDKVMKNNENVRFEGDASFRGIIRGLQDVADADFAVPEELVAVMRNYQKTGFRWLMTLRQLHFGGILADEMGLGKTLQVLALLEAERQSDAALIAIVVCPASLVLNWESEVKRFAPRLRTLALLGTSGTRQAQIKALNTPATDPEAGTDILITSYDQVRNDIDTYENIEFSYIILDEAQYIKNQKTRSANAVKRLRGRSRFALTGTPVENSLSELWSIFDFLMPGYLSTYNVFRRRFETLITQYEEKGALERLQAMVRPFILRRLKKDVLKELPPKTETIIPTTMSKEQRLVYVASLAKAKEVLDSKLATYSEQQSGIFIIAELMRLRQICCDPRLVFEEYAGGSAKLTTCLDIIENCLESGRHLLLFSQFTSMLQIIAEALDSLGITYYRLEGSTPKTERQRLVNSFNEGAVPVFLISLKAGGTGLNLTRADTVIHYDPWWNLSAERQATDRTHRIGQENNVQVYKLIVKDTIEERIVRMQEKKAALAEAVLEGSLAAEQPNSAELINLFEEALLAAGV